MLRVVLVECGGDVGEVAGRDEDVGVVDEDVLVARVREHLGEVGELAVGAEALGALDEADVDVRVVDAEAGDLGDGGVVERADAEEELEGAGVVLRAVAGEAGVHARVDALDGLEDGDAGGEGGVGLRGLACARSGGRPRAP